MATKRDLHIHEALAIVLSIVVILVAGLFVYTVIQLKDIEKKTNTKLLLLNKDILTIMNQIEGNLNDELSSFRNELDLENDLIHQSLNSFRKQNQKDLIALGQLVDEIETQSNIKLDELKADISTIQVESSDFTSIIDDVIQSVVSIGTDRGQGSGVVVDPRGFIITNKHVVEDALLIRILLVDGQIYDAQLIALNEALDLGIIKVNADLEELKFGDSDTVEIGERVIALGNPAGLSFTVTEGIVSAAHRKGPKNQLPIYIQTDVPINSGNSGGPLVDSRGRIIGINNFKISGFDGLGFAIESNTVEEFVNKVILDWEQSRLISR